MKCQGNQCNQGRKACPTPQACFLSDDELEDASNIDWAFVAFQAALIVLSVTLFALALSKAQ